MVRNLTAAEGADISIDCLITKGDFADWDFRFNFTSDIKPLYRGREWDANNAAKERMSTSNETNGKFYLHIKNVIKSDAGTYTCTDNDGFGQEIHSTLFVTSKALSKDFSTFIIQFLTIYRPWSFRSAISFFVIIICSTYFVIAF